MKNCSDLSESKSKKHKKTNPRIMVPIIKRSIFFCLNAPITKDIKALIESINSGMAGIDFKILPSILQPNLIIYLNWFYVRVTCVVLRYSSSNRRHDWLRTDSKRNNAYSQNY